MKSKSIFGHMVDVAAGAFVATVVLLAVNALQSQTKDPSWIRKKVILHKPSGDEYFTNVVITGSEPRGNYLVFIDQDGNERYYHGSFTTIRYSTKDAETN